MNFGTFLYMYFLFVILSPGILFSIPLKNKWIQVVIHGVLFSVIWLLTHKQIYYLWIYLTNKFTINEITEGITEGAMFDDVKTTPYKEPPISEDITPPLVTKCFQNDSCVGTQKRKNSSITDFFCFGGGSNGCLWGSGDCRDKGDSFCKRYNMSSKLYHGGTCTGYKLTGNPNDWGDWTCTYAVPP